MILFVLPTQILGGLGGRNTVQLTAEMFILTQNSGRVSPEILALRAMAGDSQVSFLLQELGRETNMHEKDGKGQQMTSFEGFCFPPK